MAVTEADFLCAPALRLEAHERVTEVQFERIREQVERIELMVATIERRLWLMIYGMLGVILAETFRSVMSFVT